MMMMQLFRCLLASNFLTSFCSCGWYSPLSQAWSFRSKLCILWSRFYGSCNGLQSTFKYL